MQVQVQSLHFTADVKLLEYLDKKVQKLETFFDHIISADVVMRLEKTGQVQDKILEIRLNVPGTTLIASETCKTFEEAIDLATDSLKRQLVRHKEKVKGA